ncbi:MAG TPA: hypothetical protein VGO52_13460 [Hyphomonadaceae bacterium]|jgi:hypothetical protein|nr:hypothetical protein [Hyphomonadaceae bacterium]
MFARTLVAASALAALSGCAGAPEATSSAKPDPTYAAPMAQPAPPAPVVAAAPPAPAAPAVRARIESVEKPNYVSIPMEITVNKPAKDVWARIGKYCDIGEWFQIATGCTITAGKDGEFGAVRTVGSEILIGKTELSYGYTQPVRDGRPYNLYHGYLEARPINAKSTKLVYTLMYDNSLVPGDQAAKDAEIAGRRTRFEQGLANMKILAEGGKLPPPAAPAARPAAPAAAPAAPAAAAPVRARIESVEKPTYVSIPMEITINKPQKDVWASVGKYCDIGAWLQIPAGCQITAGKDNEVGAVRTVGGEVLVGKTPYSYTYTQAVRDGRAYNLYHGTLEARAVNAKTTKMVYTLMYDNSLVAGDQAAKDAEVARRRTTFENALKNMKIIAEGGTLPPPPPRPAAAPAAAPPARQ